MPKKYYKNHQCKTCKKVERLSHKTVWYRVNKGSGNCNSCSKRGGNKTSFKKGQSSWNKGITGKDSHIFGKTWRGLSGKQNPFYGKSHSEETKKKMSEAKEGVKDHKSNAWKGDQVGYFGLHSWVKKKLGTPQICEDCGKSGLTSHQIHWANISGDYKRDLSDWTRLCASCHSKFDNIAEKSWKTRRINNANLEEITNVPLQSHHR